MLEALQKWMARVVGSPNIAKSEELQDWLTDDVSLLKTPSLTAMSPPSVNDGVFLFRSRISFGRTRKEDQENTKMDEAVGFHGLEDERMVTAGEQAARRSLTLWRK